LKWVSSMSLKVLAFVNHVPVKRDPTPVIEQALEWGVDYVIAQGTGKDWGAHWLGAGTQFPVSNFVENIRPYMKAAHEHKLPIILSAGIAGARPQLRECLAGFNSLCVEEGMEFDLGVVYGDVDHAYLNGKIKEGVQIRRMDEHPVLPEYLRVEDVDDSTYIVAQMGPEPIMAALDEGRDGVITGRALDVGLFMAPALRSGASWATAALFGKLLECAGLALHPSDPTVAIYGEIHDDDSITVRAPAGHQRCIAETLAAHSFYERLNPFREENPGGYLNLENVVYEQEDERSVRVRGAQGVATPYTVKLEGAAPLGYRAINVGGVRDPNFLAHLDDTLEKVKEEVAVVDRFKAWQFGVDYHLNFTLYGRDAVLGAAEPERDKEHEVGLLVDVVAQTEDLARDICYFASISLQSYPYPGRKTTAGNIAQRFTQLVNPVGQAYRWSIWHLLPLEDPLEPFERRHISFPVPEGEQPW